jgi:hypothetical protein
MIDQGPARTAPERNDPLRMRGRNPGIGVGEAQKGSPCPYGSETCDLCGKPMKAFVCFKGKPPGHFHYLCAYKAKIAFAGGTATDEAVQAMAKRGRKLLKRLARKKGLEAITVDE